MSGPRSSELHRSECLRLLATATLGRIVYTENALPAVHPVSFFVDDGEAICGTSGQVQVVRTVDHSVVAFQADEIDPADYAGWSVCGVGEAYAVVDPVRLADLAGRAPRSWRPEYDWPLVSVPLQQLRGSRVGDPR